MWCCDRIALPRRRTILFSRVTTHPYHPTSVPNPRCMHRRRRITRPRHLTSRRGHLTFSATALPTLSSERRRTRLKLRVLDGQQLASPREYNATSPRNV